MLFMALRHFLGPGATSFKFDVSVISYRIGLLGAILRYRPFGVPVASVLEQLNVRPRFEIRPLVFHAFRIVGLGAKHRCGHR